MRDRKMQRALHKAGIRKEDRLESRNLYGNQDLTPKKAVEILMKKQRR